MAMQVGIVLPIGQEDDMIAAPAYGEVRAVAIEAEAVGLDSVWVYDHLLFRFDGETTGIHECWTVLSAIAEATSRVGLGTIVMATSFRNPALLAKMAATLDHISEGRLILGLGCGWHDPEYEAFGYPTDHKVGRFEESLAVILGLIRDGGADLDGRWVQATAPALGRVRVAAVDRSSPDGDHRGDRRRHRRACRRRDVAPDRRPRADDPGVRASTQGSGRCRPGGGWLRGWSAGRDGGRYRTDWVNAARSGS